MYKKNYVYYCKKKGVLLIEMAEVKQFKNVLFYFQLL